MNHRSFFALALALAAANAAAQSGTPSGCTVVAGGGRHLPAADALIKDRWNRLNFSFFDAATTAFGDNDKVVQAFFPVESSDPRKNSEAALAEAAKAGCGRVLFVSVFDDETRPEPELVFALRALTVQKEAGRTQPPQFAGAPVYEREYRYPATPESLARVVPSRIAERAIDEYLRSARP